MEGVCGLLAKYKLLNIVIKQKIMHEFLVFSLHLAKLLAAGTHPLYDRSDCLIAVKLLYCAVLVMRVEFCPDISFPFDFSLIMYSKCVGLN